MRAQVGFPAVLRLEFVARFGGSNLGHSCPPRVDGRCRHRLPQPTPFLEDPFLSARSLWHSYGVTRKKDWCSRSCAKHGGLGFSEAIPTATAHLQGLPWFELRQ